MAPSKKRTAPSDDQPGRNVQKQLPKKPRLGPRTAKFLPKKGSKKETASKSTGAINQIPTDVMAVFVFGNGDNGELGLGPKRTESPTPCQNPYLDARSKSGSAYHVVRIAAGGMHTVALTADNSIVTWGVNDSEALGRNTTWDGGLRDVDAESDDDAELNPLESTPTAIPSSCFPAGTLFVDVAAGNNCSFALTDAGLVYGWGTFRDPQGNERFGYKSDGALIEKQATPVPIDGLEKITQIVCGNDHALALDVQGNIWAWGSIQQNQIGHRHIGRYAQGSQDTLQPRIIRVCRNSTKYIASGDYHCFAVDKRDNVWGWGLNSFGQAGDTTTAGSALGGSSFPMKIHGLCGKGVHVLSGGAHHSAAVTGDGQFMVWGRLDGGQLGVEFAPEKLQDEHLIRRDEYDKPRICLRPTAVQGCGKAAYVACGTDHTIFINSKGQAFSTGFNSEGQLGLGSEDDVSVAQKILEPNAGKRFLTWAGAGGQFSIVAGPYKV